MLVLDIARIKYSKVWVQNNGSKSNICSLSNHFKIKVCNCMWIANALRRSIVCIFWKPLQAASAAASRLPPAVLQCCSGPWCLAHNHETGHGRRLKIPINPVILIYNVTWLAVVSRRYKQCSAKKQTSNQSWHVCTQAAAASLRLHECRSSGYLLALSLSPAIKLMLAVCTKTLLNLDRVTNKNGNI